MKGVQWNENPYETGLSYVKITSLNLTLIRKTKNKSRGNRVSVEGGTKRNKHSFVCQFSFIKLEI